MRLVGRPAGIMIDGVVYLRSRYGMESWVIDDPDIRWPDECPDCGIKRGELHHARCGIEMCPKCGRQLDTCSCLSDRLV